MGRQWTDDRASSLSNAIPVGLVMLMAKGGTLAQTHSGIQGAPVSSLHERAG